MKKNFCFLATGLLVAFFAFSLNAQTPQYYNSNTNSAGNNNFPFGMGAGKAVNWLFRAGEINQPTPIPTGKRITKVYFQAGSVGAPVYSNLQILMAQSTITDLTFAQFYPGPWDTVYNHPTTTIPTTTIGGWVSLMLDHTFNYDPAKSLIIFVGQCGFSGSGFAVQQSAYSGIKRVWSVGGCPFVVYTVNSDGMTVDFGVDVEEAVGIGQHELQTSELQVYPNPASVITTIKFHLREAAKIKINIYNIYGQLVKTLADTQMTTGTYETQWDLTNIAGNRVSKGIYLCKIISGKKIFCCKIFVEI
jgi:hypothetical protein